MSSYCSWSCFTCTSNEQWGMWSGFQKGSENIKSSYGDGVFQCQVLVSLFKYSLITLRSRIQIVRTFVIILKYPLKFPNTTRRSGYKLKRQGEQRDLERRPQSLAAEFGSNVSYRIPYFNYLILDFTNYGSSTQNIMIRRCMKFCRSMHLVVDPEALDCHL